MTLMILRGIQGHSVIQGHNYRVSFEFLDKFFHGLGLGLHNLVFDHLAELRWWQKNLEVEICVLLNDIHYKREV